MSDQTKYINTYLDIALSTVHENLNNVLQLKTQLKILNDLVSEKDQVIETLQSENSENKTSSEKLKSATDRARQWEDSFNAMKSKVAHMDTLTAQYNEFKSNLIAKSDECNTLKTELDARRAEIEAHKAEIQAQKAEIEELKKQIKQETKVPLVKSSISKKAINSKDTSKTTEDTTTSTDNGNDDF